MKHPMLLLLFCASAFFASPLHACATCIGTVEQDSPPFFSDELYQLDEQEKEASEQNNNIALSVEEN